jgi:hypothetical protein
MGGSGGGRYSGPPSEPILRKIQRAREQGRLRVEGEVNELLKRLLAHFNDRPTEQIGDRLTELQSCLSEAVEIDRILFGGSVAKHTDVSGLSDVDALVILDRQDLAGQPPQVMLEAFSETLKNALPRGEVLSIEKGHLAVTVTYKDSHQIQLLPALHTGQTVSISTADGKTWSDIKPRVFERELTKANERQNFGLVPAIKLFKSIVSTFPQQKRLTGYHMEALSIEAVRDYEGPKTSKALLLRILDRASQVVLSPLLDVTGHSKHLDSYLGGRNSLERRNESQALSGMKRRLEAATTVAQWHAVFEGL